ncbi:hypothetical protein IU474_14580 [Nocardia otitidiscaviarum]|uniref:hypothetical protein n=1 Tax=Nocardia otitidiscaviarum TaxID=1823 RepID=UPI00189343F8|nr:hypothetical protein [Nocardia otitidiscaviarum]MBF6238282.1 hypothetical protein [Nocardia otitidiscaviarum]
MKPLSESLLELSDRVKRIEEASAAAREKNRAAVQARREEFESAVEREGKEFEHTATEMREATQRWWAETKTALERQFEAMRADFEQWQADAHGEAAGKASPRAVQSAEDVAEVAVVLARYCLDAAEWAVARAQRALGDTEDKADVPTEQPVRQG